RLGLRLRQLGVAVRHDPRLRVVVGAIDNRHLLRGCARVLHGQLQARPGRLSWRDRAAWAWQLAWWPVPGVVALWAVAAFVVAAGRLASGDPFADWWSVAFGRATPSWLALASAAAVWLGALVGPALVWGIARRDLGAGRLLRAAL